MRPFDSFTVYASDSETVYDVDATGDVVKTAEWRLISDSRIEYTAYRDKRVSCSDVYEGKDALELWARYHTRKEFDEVEFERQHLIMLAESVETSMSIAHKPLQNYKNLKETVACYIQNHKDTIHLDELERLKYLYAKISRIVEDGENPAGTVKQMKPMVYKSHSDYDILNMQK